MDRRRLRFVGIVTVIVATQTFCFITHDTADHGLNGCKGMHCPSFEDSGTLADSKKSRLCCNMTTMPLNLFLPDAGATDDLARAVATLVLGTTPSAANTAVSPAIAYDGPTNGVAIYLQGNLGAGKTAFARAFLQQCGVMGRIKSPSYALLESYKVSSLYFYHIDFYRFSDPREWEDAGFRDLFRPNSVVLIEWPEKAAGQLPPPDLHISLQYEDKGRTAGLQAETKRGQQWLKTFTQHGPVT